MHFRVTNYFQLENNDGLLFNYSLIMNICLENCAQSVKMKQNKTGKIAVQKLYIRGTASVLRCYSWT
jgi:hypothetical protein